MVEISTPVELTKFLVRHDTSTGSIDPSFLPKLIEWLETRGFSIVSTETNGVQHIAATIGPDAPKLKLAFVGHYDTVPVGSGWNYPANGAVEEEGVLYGRGASDMKSGDAAMIFAAMKLATSGVRSTVFLPGDEETKSLGMPALLDARSWDFDYCIGGEPTSKVSLGDYIKVGRRGLVQGKIHLLGKAGHAAYAERTPNIINQIPAVLSELSRPWEDKCHGTETTVAITNVTTDSTATNVIPGTVALTFDARFSPRRTIDEVKAEIARRVEASGVSHSIEMSKGTNSYLTDFSGDASSPQSKLIQSLIDAIKETLGVAPVLTCDGGVSDARFVAWRGVPTIECGVPHGNMHGPDEFVKSRDIELLTEIFCGAVRSLIER
jgi:succinyl-diaminopimelate desuccinylase